MPKKLSVKKPTRKQLVKKLDATFSLYIRTRDDHKCIVCGSRLSPTCGHLITRSKYIVRWDERNCCCQCWPCNFNHELNPHPFVKAYIKKYGLLVYNQLVQDSYNKENKKFTDKELEEKIEFYKLI